MEDLWLVLILFALWSIGSTIEQLDKDVVSQTDAIVQAIRTTGR